MARERELLMLLARESRGSRGRDLCVRLLTSTDDAGAMQLVMPAVLGGELFHLLQDYGKMSEPATQFICTVACPVRVSCMTICVLARWSICGL